MCYLGFQYYMGLLGGCYNNTQILIWACEQKFLSGSNTILISVGLRLKVGDRSRGGGSSSHSRSVLIS